MSQFVAVDIGCIECGESSALIGVYDTHESAQQACDTWQEVGWRGGQHSYEVFDLDSGIGLPDKGTDGVA